MHQPPNVRVPNGGEGYARSYDRWVTALAVLFGVFLGSQALNGGAMMLFDVSEDVSGVFREWGEFAAVLSVAAAAVGLAVLPLSLVLPLLFSRIPVPPRRLPPWTTSEQARTARALVNEGVLSNDPWTDQVARAWADTILWNAGHLSSPALRLIPVASGVLMLAMNTAAFAWGAREGDVNQMSLQANSFALFGAALLLVPLQTRQVGRARRFRGLHEAAYGKVSR
ncbi:hypothetical protein A9R04_26700 [Nocardiopsis dassonvillei]|uniref:hypothetical protein n=1 Tax=Nocardiopsis dassonvillei TaxID=2014 RepID=UPI0008FC3A78|nr:hypothetical protein [Nocardiopsis dassonvillei]APC38039.1 hypothetical protein A9R04_26700 [Nocardiopsis dassonvillei]